MHNYLGLDPIGFLGSGNQCSKPITMSCLFKEFKYECMFLIGLINMHEHAKACTNHVWWDLKGRNPLKRY